MSEVHDRGLVNSPAAMRAGDWLSVLLAWIVAAILVSALHQIASLQAGARFMASVAAILFVSFLHARGAFPRNHVHPLIVGAVWLALSIVSEMLINAFLGQEWDGMLGAPGERTYRTMMLITWAISPLIFARRHVR